LSSVYPQKPQEKTKLVEWSGPITGPLGGACMGALKGKIFTRITHSPGARGASKRKGKVNKGEKKSSRPLKLMAGLLNQNPPRLQRPTK